MMESRLVTERAATLRPRRTFASQQEFDEYLLEMQGKYAWVPTSSVEFMQRRQEELAREQADAARRT